MEMRQMLILQRKLDGICNRSARKLLKWNTPGGWKVFYQQQLRTCVSFKMKLPEVPLLVQNDGTVVPHIGIGTSKSKGSKCEDAIKNAITFGYRSIDTAYTYRNEVEVGKAIRAKIKEGIVKREELFITTKLASIHHDPSCVEYACRLSLKNLGLDYVDLYLMHWPFGFVYVGDDILYPLDCNKMLNVSTVDFVETWNAMEKLVDLCLTRSIGVSNFNSAQIARLVKEARIKPVQNQIEVNPMFLNSQLTDFCKENCIIVTGHSPFASVNPAAKTPKFLYDTWITEIAKNHNKTPFQIILRYLIERGVIPIPKSMNQYHIIENLDIFTFKLTTRDHFFLEKYNSGQRTIPFEAAKHSFYYPFYSLF